MQKMLFIIWMGMLYLDDLLKFRWLKEIEKPLVKWDIVHPVVDQDVVEAIQEVEVAVLAKDEDIHFHALDQDQEVGVRQGGVHHQGEIRHPGEVHYQGEVAVHLQEELAVHSHKVAEVLLDTAEVLSLFEAGHLYEVEALVGQDPDQDENKL